MHCAHPNSDFGKKSHLQGCDRHPSAGHVPVESSARDPARTEGAAIPELAHNLIPSSGVLSVAQPCPQQPVSPFEQYAGLPEYRYARTLPSRYAEP